MCEFNIEIYEVLMVLLRLQCYSLVNQGMDNFPFIIIKREISMGPSL